MYTTQADVLLHREGLLKVINDGIENVPATSKEIAPNSIKSRQLYDQIQTHAGLGLFQNFDETEGVTFDAITPRFSKTYYSVNRSLGIKYSETALNMDLYGFVKSQGALLAKSAVATENYLAAQVLNLGFGGGQTSPDGSNLFATGHSLSVQSPVATSSNLITQGMSGISLENALQVGMSHLGDRGIPKYFNGGFKLVVGPLNAGVAERSAKSSGLQGTNDNDTNSFVHGMISKVVVDQMIGYASTSLQYNWFLLPTDASENPIVRIETAPITVDHDFDIEYQAHKFVATFMVIYDVFGWRGLVGSQN